MYRLSTWTCPTTELKPFGSYTSKWECQSSELGMHDILKSYSSDSTHVKKWTSWNSWANKFKPIKSNSQLLHTTNQNIATLYTKSFLSQFVPPHHEWRYQDTLGRYMHTTLSSFSQMEDAVGQSDLRKMKRMISGTPPKTYHLLLWVEKTNQTKEYRLDNVMSHSHCFDRKKLNL